MQKELKCKELEEGGGGYNKESGQVPKHAIIHAKQYYGESQAQY
jgi:hypothetical protein